MRSRFSGDVCERHSETLASTFLLAISIATHTDIASFIAFCCVPICTTAAWLMAFASIAAAVCSDHMRMNLRRARWRGATAQARTHTMPHTV